MNNPFSFMRLILIKCIWIFLLLSSVASAVEPPDPNGDYVVIDNEGRETFVVSVDPQIKNYLDSIDPKRVEIVRYGDFVYRLLTAPRWNMKIDGQWVDFETYISPYDSRWESDLPGTVPVPVRVDVDIDSFKAAVVTSYGDWGDKAFAWLTQPGQPWGCDLEIVDGSDIKLKGLDSGRGVVQIGRNGDPFQYAGKFQEIVMNYANANTKDRILSYKTEVEGFDDADAYMQIQKDRLNKALKVVSYGSKLYLSGVSFFSTPGAMVIGVDDLQEGHWSGLLAFLPVLPALASTGKAVRAIREILVIDKSAVVFRNGSKVLSDGAIPLMRISAEDLSLLQQINAKVGDLKGNIFTFSKEVSSRLTPELVKKLGSWFFGICRGDQCLAPETLVWTPEGPEKICDIIPGQMVLSWNEEWNTSEWARVDSSMLTESNAGVDITLDDKPEVSEIKATEGHQFLVKLKSGATKWERADELQVGDYIAGNDHDSRIANLQKICGIHDYYNLDIDILHTYIIGKEGVICHNKCARALFDELRTQLNLKFYTQVYRNLLDDETLFTQAWPALRAMAKGVNSTKKQLAIQASNMNFLRGLMLDISPGAHEWIPRVNITRILSDASGPTEAWKMMRVMNFARSNAGTLWFNAKGKDGLVQIITDAGERLWVRAGHSTDLESKIKYTSQYFADDFHIACNKAFTDSLKFNPQGEITGISLQLWKSAITNILGQYFKGGQLVIRQNELNLWIANAKGCFLP